MANQIPTRSKSASSFLADFLTFLRYVETHRIRVTALNRHIPLRHLNDLEKIMSGVEPFHPLHSNTTYEMRCQRDRARLDFMDSLAHRMELLERSEWGYILLGQGWGKFMQLEQKHQAEECWNAFWCMDWNDLYPWSQVVDAISQQRTSLLSALLQCKVANKESLMTFSEIMFPAMNIAEGFFWIVIRPLEFLDLAKGHFALDAQGFWFPEAFELTEKFYAMPKNFPP